MNSHILQNPQLSFQFHSMLLDVMTLACSSRAPPDSEMANPPEAQFMIGAPCVRDD